MKRGCGDLAKKKVEVRMAGGGVGVRVRDRARGGRQPFWPGGRVSEGGPCPGVRSGQFCQVFNHFQEIFLLSQLRSGVSISLV